MQVILSIPDEGYSEHTWWRLFWAYLMKVIHSSFAKDRLKFVHMFSGGKLGIKSKPLTLFILFTTLQIYIKYKWLLIVECIWDLWYYTNIEIATI
jgi:hypothetical protein